MAEIDLGVDLSAVEDLEPAMPLVSGRTCLIQALARRLTTPRGALWYAPNYGDDIRRFLNTPIDPQVVATSAANELALDDRVDSVSVVASFSESSETLTLDISVADAEGPFAFTLTVDAVSASTLLKAA